MNFLFVEKRAFAKCILVAQFIGSVLVAESCPELLGAAQDAIGTSYRDPTPAFGAPP